jgi:hypothetical protein
MQEVGHGILIVLPCRSNVPHRTGAGSSGLRRRRRHGVRRDTQQQVGVAKYKAREVEEVTIQPGRFQHLCHEWLGGDTGSAVVGDSQMQV